MSEMLLLFWKSGYLVFGLACTWIGLAGAVLVAAQITKHMIDRVFGVVVLSEAIMEARKQGRAPLFVCWVRFRNWCGVSEKDHHGH